ncbi:hypothetical protein QN277_023152 [Acacia crassicarpa]|uniref:TF-B3 domain-containing protein n=1 Tax=Acacia crassicarpa TaxID=499986 RepID=A0AAE1MQE0_9FABA|nr:hypothetical protein QN277_023152 [Acacia crassicarpa]
MEPINPSFFKILINHFSTRLQIPPSFMITFGEVIPNQTILEAFGKNVEVKVEKIGERLYFSNGWSKFVKANNLELGDFLLFKYFPDHSKFKVTVYGKTCCVKQFNNVARERCSEPVKVKQGRKRKLQVDTEGFVEAKRMKSEFYSTEVIKIDSDSSSSDDDDDHETEFTSENPFFQVQLPFSYIAGNYLYIPARFFSEHMMKESKKVRFEISRRSWNMKLRVTQRRSGAKVATISNGWKRFVEELHLQVGDVCFFELIKTVDPDFVFIVHVYRRDRENSKFV